MPKPPRFFDRLVHWFFFQWNQLIESRRFSRLNKLFQSAAKANQESSLGLIRIGSGVLDTCAAHGENISHSAINLSVYVGVLNLDLNIMLSQFFATRKDWERNLIARHLALAMLEGLEDIAELNGACISTMKQNNPNFERLKRASRVIADLRWKYEGELRLIRLSVCAHREKNAQVLWKAVREIEVEKIIGISNEVTTGLGEVIQQMREVLILGCEGCRYAAIHQASREMDAILGDQTEAERAKR